MSTSRLRLGRMSSRVAVVGAVGAIAVGVVACGSDSGSDSSGSSGSSSGGGSGDKVVVGLITKTESNPFFVKMKEAAQKAADANNATLVTAAGKQDTDNQSQVTVNDCPRHNTNCAAGFLGRFAFQPLRENPLLGPSSATYARFLSFRFSYLFPSSLAVSLLLPVLCLRHQQR
jgi:hypothetical protein